MLQNLFVYSNIFNFLVSWFIHCIADIDPECIVDWLAVNYMSLSTMIDSFSSLDSF